MLGTKRSRDICFDANVTEPPSDRIRSNGFELIIPFTLSWSSMVFADKKRLFGLLSNQSLPASPVRYRRFPADLPNSRKARRVCHSKD